MGNHWSNSGDLVIEEKTLFRQIGWYGQSGRFYSMKETPTESGSYAPIYEQISTWVEGEGWKD
jgi:hypothetical protein